MKKSIFTALLLMAGCTNPGAITFFDSSPNGVGEKTFTIDEVDLDSDKGIITVTALFEDMPDNPQSPSYKTIVKFNNAGKVQSVSYTYDQNPKTDGNEGTATCPVACSGPASLCPTACTGVEVDTGDHTITFSNAPLSGTYDGKPWSIKAKGAINY